MYKNSFGQLGVGGVGVKIEALFFPCVFIEMWFCFYF